jgi:hypothetical protein
VRAQVEPLRRAVAREARLGVVGLREIGRRARRRGRPGRVRGEHHGETGAGAVAQAIGGVPCVRPRGRVGRADVRLELV